MKRAQALSKGRAEMQQPRGSVPSVERLSRVQRVGVAAALALLIAAALLWGFGSSEQPTDTSALTTEARRAMDVVLFNELFERKRGSFETRAQRYEKLKAMAERGFEPAALAIRLYHELEPGLSWRELVFDWFTYWRIEALAKAGDPSAACLAAQAIRDFKALKGKRDQLYKYIRQAADAGQPHCLFLLSGYYEYGKPPVTQDWVKARELHEAAARKGHVLAQVMLVREHATGVNGRTVNLGMARCWQQLAMRSGTVEARSNQSTLNWLIRKARERGIKDDFPVYDPDSGCETVVPQ